LREIDEQLESEGELVVPGDRIELTSAPTWAVNNIIRRHERLPLRLIAA
jgi:hypothetical protein